MTDESRTPNEHTVKSVFVRAHPFALTTSHEERRAEFDRFVANIKADARRSLLEELRADAELEASIGRQGNDDERVKTAEKVIEMLNDTRVEDEA